MITESAGSCSIMPNPFDFPFYSFIEINIYVRRDMCRMLSMNHFFLVIETLKTLSSLQDSIHFESFYRILAVAVSDIHSRSVGLPVSVSENT